MSKKVFLLDGYAMLYRAHFAFIRNPLRNSRGEDTSALFGLLLQLARLIEKCSPEYLAFVLDSRTPTFRHQMYEQYKATREKMPEEMRSQIPHARELLERGLRIPICELDGFEADDVIGTLARRIAAAGMEAVIVSGDKDFYQLIGPGITLYNPHGEDVEWVDGSNAHERLGVAAGQTIDYLALMGDSSDNVPGVRGIGKVTATKLLNEFGSLDAIYDRIGEVKPESVRNKLIEGRDGAILSRELVTIRTDLELNIELESMRRVPPDDKILDELFRRHEIFKLREKFGLGFSPPQIVEAAPVEKERDYRLAGSLDELEKLAAGIRAKGVFAVDTETTSLDPGRAELVGVSLAWEPGVAWYVPLAHRTGPNLDRGRALALLKPLLESETIGCIGQNIKYDLLVFSRYGITVRNIVGDPMLASYLLDPGRRSHGLDSLAWWLFNHRMISYGEVTGKGKQQVLFNEVEVDAARAYSAEDADMALCSALELEKRLTGEGRLLELYRQVELPLITVLARMEANGVALDVPFLEKLSAGWEVRLGELERRAHALAGHEFNVNSTRQLAQVLFEEQGIEPGKKTKGKTGFSTDSSVLEELSLEHELPAVILELRELAKLKSTYVDSLPRQINPATGRVHTSFNQVVAATGRLSSSNPNLQNIPIRTEEGRTIRRAFVPSGPGRVLLSADYSQIELRILAHLAGDEAMIEAFTSGVDIHTQTASRLFGLKPEQVGVQERSRAKTINFGVLYGMGAHRLSNELKIPFREAKRFIDDYFARFPSIREYIERQKEQARAQGWVETILGRRRNLPEITSANRVIRENAERMALNTPIQGSAADLIKVAMLHVDKALAERFPEARMILQVHDELVFDVPETQAELVGQAVRELMENAVKLDVPVRVDLGVGHNWLEAK